MSELTPKVSRHGKACVNCARAKVKCVERNLGGACERCERLSKDCQPIVRQKRQRVVKKASAATKTAELEEKLDGLVSLLTAATQAQSTSSSSAPSYQNSKPTSPNQPSCQEFRFCDSQFDAVKCLQNNATMQMNLAVDNPYRITSIPVDPPLPGIPSREKTSAYPGPLIPPDLELSAAEAEEVLHTFRTQSVKFFPFISIPESTTARKFREENPCLWVTIMMITSKTTARQITLGTHIRTFVGRKLLIEGERNLDLLWALLTYMAWGQCHYAQRPVWTSLILLAMGIIFDLGLNKAPPKESPHLLLNYDIRGCPKPYLPSAGSLQERRALLCCFSLSSTLSSFVQKVDTLRWTSYADESLKVLIENHESIEDIQMVQIVRLQLIQEKAKEAPWYDSPSDINASFKAPALFYLKALKVQMENFKQQIPLEVQNSRIVLLHLYNTELTIHEVALSKELTPDMESFQRIESLCVCLQSVKSWFEIFLEIPLKDQPFVSYLVYTHLAHCMVALYRLSVFEDEEWDTTLVRQQLDFSIILDRIINLLNCVKVAAGLDQNVSPEFSNIDVYSTSAKRIALIKSWWDAKVASENMANVGSNNNSMGGLEVPESIPSNMFGMDGNQEFLPGDDAWWQDIFGPWSMQGVGDGMTMGT